MQFRPVLFLLSLVSVLVYLSLTVLIVHFFHDATLASVFDHGFILPVQILTGIAFGLIAAGVIAFVMFRTPIAGILKDYTIVEMLSEMQLSSFDRAQISLFAGFGEELLFRGAIQPVLGIWVTSLLFVALHGYIKFTSLRHILFGVLMFGLSAGLGFLYEWAGLVAAMTAHAVYDHVLLHVGETHGFGASSHNNETPDDDESSSVNEISDDKKSGNNESSGFDKTKQR